MSERTATRIALGAIAACTSATALYAFLRVVQKLRCNEPDPALVLWSEHAGYYWRAWTAAYVGGMFGFVAYVVARNSPARTARFLATAVVVTAIALTAQGLLVP